MSLTNKYIKGVTYNNLGVYLGIITVYPHGVDFVEHRHKFAKPRVTNDRDCAKITEILIESIPKTDV